MSGLREEADVTQSPYSQVVDSQRGGIKDAHGHAGMKKDRPCGVAGAQRWKKSQLVSGG